MAISLLAASVGGWVAGLRRPDVTRAPVPRASATAAPLQRVVHRASDPAKVAQFYESCIGLQQLAADGATLLGRSEAGLCLEVVPGDASGGYATLSARVPDVDEAVRKVRDWYGEDATAVVEAETVEHGASLIPDQPDDTVTPIKQATVQDPSGATLVLWEGGSAPTLSAALLPVYEWKTSQSWCALPCLLERVSSLELTSPFPTRRYEETLGWSTLRQQSNVPLEASMTFTLGVPADEAPGPCGPMGDEPAGVLQIRYDYGSKKPKVEDGLVALVVGSGTADALSDPDGYPVKAS